MKGNSSAVVFIFSMFLAALVFKLLIVWAVVSAGVSGVKAGLDKCDAKWPVEAVLATNLFCDTE